MFPNLRADQQERVVNEVTSFAETLGSVEREVVAAH
jgi:hypothetical protein